MSSTSRTDLEGGKYTIVHEDGANLRVLRHGDDWIGPGEVVGGKMLIAVAAELDDLRAKLALPDAEPVATSSEARACEILSLEEWVPYPLERYAEAKESGRQVRLLYPPLEARLALPDAEPVAQDVERAVRIAFESSNDGPNLAMNKYWYEKGLRSGLALTTPQPAIAPETVTLTDAEICDAIMDAYGFVEPPDMALCRAIESALHAKQQGRS